MNIPASTAMAVKDLSALPLKLPKNSLARLLLPCLLQIVRVGHTELRQGAFALAPICQHEYTFNRGIAQAMEMAAASNGIAVRTFFRDRVGISGAYQAATVFEPDGIIELHFNAASAAARGTETLCSKDHPGSKKLADLIQKSMVAVFNRTDSIFRLRERG